MGENSHLESKGGKKKNPSDVAEYIKNCSRAPEVIQVMLDQEENLDHLDQRCVYLCTRIFVCLFLFEL